MPGFIFKPGRIGVVSKSGTLTYEAADQVAKAGLGVSTAVGIGGDPIIGTTTKEALEMFMNDPNTDGVVVIGEIGGGMEAEAARWYKDNAKKTCCRIYSWSNCSSRQKNGSCRRNHRRCRRYGSSQNENHE